MSLLVLLDVSKLEGGFLHGLSDARLHVIEVFFLMFDWVFKVLDEIVDLACLVIRLQLHLLLS